MRRRQCRSLTQTLVINQLGCGSQLVRWTKATKAWRQLYNKGWLSRVVWRPNSFVLWPTLSRSLASSKTIVLAWTRQTALRRLRMTPSQLGQLRLSNKLCLHRRHLWPPIGAQLTCRPSSASWRPERARARAGATRELRPNPIGGGVGGRDCALCAPARARARARTLTRTWTPNYRQQWLV